jgi:hypothetical protein
MSRMSSSQNYFYRGMKRYFARNFEAVTDTTRQTAEIDTEITLSSLLLTLLGYEV